MQGASCCSALSSCSRWSPPLLTPSTSTTSPPGRRSWPRPRTRNPARACPRRSRRSTTTSTATSASGPSGRCGGTRSCRSRSCSSIAAGSTRTPVTIHEVTPEGVRDVTFDPEAVRLRQEQARPQRAARAGVRRLSRALPGQHAELQGRGAGVPGRQLLPRARQGPAVRPVRARPRHRHRGGARARSSRGSPSSGSSGRSRRRKELTIYALLDSPRATGAYRFVLKPGVTTALDVDARLFLRKNVAKLGLAPLTSMFHFGENQRRRRDDYRPRGPRLRRPVDPERRRRVDLAAAGQSEAAAGDVVRADRPARVRPDAARAGRSATTRTSRRGTTCGPRPGSSRRGRGARAAWSWCRSRCPTRPTTTSSRTGFRDWQPKPREAVRLRLSHAVAEGAARCGRRSAGSRETRRGRGYMKSSRRQRRAPRRLRGAHAQPDAVRRAIVDTRRGSTPTARSWNDARSATRSRGLAHRVRFSRIDGGKPVELRALPAPRQRGPVGDVELHPSAESRLTRAAHDSPAAASTDAHGVRGMARPAHGARPAPPARPTAGSLRATAGGPPDAACTGCCAAWPRLGAASPTAW